MRTTYKVFLAFGMMLFSVLLSSFYSPNASAVNFSYNLNDYDWITSVNLGTQYCAYSYNTFGSSPSICILTKNNPNMYGLRSYNIAHEKDDLAEFYIGVQSNINGADNYRNYGAFIQNFGAIDDNFTIIGVDTVTDQNIAQNFFGFYGCSSPPSGSSYGLWMCDTDNSVRQTYYAYIIKVTILFTTKGSHPVGVKALNANTPIMTCKLDSLAGSGAQCQVRLFGFTQWGYVGSDTKKAIDNQTQQQQNQYNHEKQEESQREQSASGDSSQAQGLFNFNVLNPFANLWNAFNSSGCVSIPTIAGMLHSTNTIYCPWFPSSVRSTVTPVMAIASSMLLFGFVVRWLSGNSGDIYGARNMNKELNG